MPDFTKILSGLSVENLAIFILVILPGFIALKVYDLHARLPKRDIANSFLDACVYGLLNFGVWAIVLVPINQKQVLENAPGWYAVASLVFLVLSPAIGGWAVYKFRTSSYASHLDHPTRRGWDWFIGAGPTCWMLFHFKNGKMLGGYFGGDSFAATCPDEPEVYVEEVWRVDEQGKFVEVVDGTFGMVVRLSDCERVEFLKVKEQQNVQTTAPAPEPVVAANNEGNDHR